MHRRSLRVLPALVAAGLAASASAGASDCHPALDKAKPQYMIGYGSLMEKASKQRTAPNTGANLPVLVTGFQRSWNARRSDVGFSTTYLGVQAKTDAEMVAVLYQNFSADDIAATDDHEAYYCRDAVDPGAVKMLDRSSVPAEGQIWIYVNKPDAVHLPNARWPIVQSYVDIFVTGCFQKKEKVLGWNRDFAEACIETTDGWSTHWVNDRLYPRRPFIYQPNASAIDKLLQKLLPEEFKAIRIE